MLPMLICFGVPLLLAIYAQGLVKIRYAKAKHRPASITGAAAARLILDSADLQHVEIEMISGQLSDHYDPRAKVIRLSQDVYQGRTLAAVGIAAHEAGHAIQDARNYLPLVMTQLAWPLAAFGSNFSFILLFIGALMHIMGLVLAGVILFGFVALYQIINLPVEFNASNRAKQQLSSLGIVKKSDLACVRGVLGAAALTYVAAMLTALLQFLYYLMIFFNRD